MGLHIDDVRAPRGRLPEEQGGALALVGIHPDFDLPEHAVPNSQTDGSTPVEEPAPVADTPSPAAAHPRKATVRHRRT